MKIKLKISEISHQLYNLLLEEMSFQNPEIEYFEDWKISFEGTKKEVLK